MKKFTLIAFMTGPLGWLVAAGVGLIANWDSVKQWFILLWNEPGAAIDIFVEMIRSKFGADFATIGISLDGRTGQLNLDEKKLSDALTSSPDKVKSLLAGNNSLGKAIEYISKEMANTPVGSYLKPPSAQDNKNYASSYSSNGWMMQQNNLMQGLFLNMTV